MPTTDQPSQSIQAIAQELISLRDLIRWAVSEFNRNDLAFGQGSDNAWDEAVYLLLHTLNLPLDTLDPFIDARLLTTDRIKCINIIRQRIISRKPAAYLTGEAWLQGFKFLVDERVIIPRSPIAELIMESFEPWLADPGNVHKILDLCTGSGCLAILAAYVFENAIIDAVDISSPVLKLTRQNIELHQMQDRVNVIQANLYDNLKPAAQYDLIICNPPYVNSAAMSELPPEYLHEPKKALAGGADGMDLIHKIIQQAPGYMSDNGLLILEIGHEKDHFEHAFPNLEPMWLSTQGASDQILLLNKAQIKND